MLNVSTVNNLLLQQEQRARDEIKYAQNDLDNLKTEIETAQRKLNDIIAYQAELAQELAARCLTPRENRG